MTHHPLTFLFTDFEDSSRLWKQFTDEIRIALAQIGELIMQAIDYFEVSGRGGV